MTYAIPGLVGAGAGLLLHRRLRRGAWIPAVALPAGVWCIAAASAFTQGRARRSLREVRLQAAIGLRPEQARQIRFREMEARIESCPLPLYGLPAIWEGSRSLGGWAEGPAGVNQVTLAHGDPEDRNAAFLRVEVSPARRFGGDQQVRRRLTRELRARPPRPPSAPPPPPAGSLALPPAGKGASVWAVTVGSQPGGHEEDQPEPPDDAWCRVSLRVDGQEVVFTYLEEAGAWIAWAMLGDVAVKVHATGFPVEGVELVRVLDLGPYLTGSRRGR